MRVPLLDLGSQRTHLGGAVEARIEAVLDHGRFVSGPEVAELERELMGWAGVPHVIGCSSGTDALVLLLMAHGVGVGDAVVVPDFTFPATPETVALLGATPIFADVLPDTFNLDPDSADDALHVARRLGLRPRAVLAVDLFGQPADYDRLLLTAGAHDAVVLVDAAQSLGATWHGLPATALGDGSATSFFPAKPLGCYGDGGAVFTADDELADAVRSLCMHGTGEQKYDTVRIGLNARLDTLQAAVLLAKLPSFADELAARRANAAQYSAALAEVAAVPTVHTAAKSSWAQYTLRVPDRDRVAHDLGDRGVASAIYYRRPLHHQPAYRRFPSTPGGCPVAEQLSAEVLSIPVHPFLTTEERDYVVEAVQSVVPDPTGSRGH